MQWYVTTEGKTSEPSDERAILEAIRSGLDPSAMICEVGGKDWRALASHPAFAAALAERLPPPPPPQQAAPTLAVRENVTAVQAIFGIIGAAIMIWGAYSLHSCSSSFSEQTRRQERQAAQEKAADELAFAQAKAQLAARKPANLKQAVEAIGRDPFKCSPDAYSGEAICVWYFKGGSSRSIRVFADNDRLGARVNNVQITD